MLDSAFWYMKCGVGALLLTSYLPVATAAAQECLRMPDGELLCPENKGPITEPPIRVPTLGVDRVQIGDTVSEALRKYSNAQVVTDQNGGRRVEFKILFRNRAYRVYAYADHSNRIDRLLWKRVIGGKWSDQRDRNYQRGASEDMVIEECDGRNAFVYGEQFAKYYDTSLNDVTTYDPEIRTEHPERYLEKTWSGVSTTVEFGLSSIFMELYLRDYKSAILLRDGGGTLHEYSCTTRVWVGPWERLVRD